MAACSPVIRVHTRWAAPSTVAESSLSLRISAVTSSTMLFNSLSVIFIVFHLRSWTLLRRISTASGSERSSRQRSIPVPRSLPLAVLIRGPSLQKISDFLFDSGARAVQQDSHDHGRRPHQARDLGVVVPFVIFQDEHLGGLFAELRDRAAQATAQFAVPLLQFGTESRIGRQDRRYVVNRNGFDSRALSHQIERGIDRRAMKIAPRIRFQVHVAPPR